MSDLAIIDSGGANIASLVFALQRLDCDAMLTRDVDAIRRATRVILPGVGAAADAMTRLEAAGLARVIPALEQPVLGICLGMQLLFDASEEGPSRCLGILAGTAQRFQRAPGRSVPHMGWNQLEVSQPCPLLRDVASGEYAYFVHSYRLPVGPATVATSDYGGPFSAIVSHGNFHGTQFHPERSGRVGATVLRNFLEIG